MAEGLRPRDPLAPPQVLPAELASRRNLGGDTYWIEFLLSRPSPPALPGQFYMLRRREGWPVLLARPFSLASWGGDGRRLGFLVEVVGRGSRALAEADPGTKALLWGPLGKAFPRADGAVLVAGGVGLAPFLLAWESGERPARILFGGRNAARLAPLSCLPGEAPLERATDDGSQGFRGTVVDLLEDLLARGSLSPGAPLFACGPEPMMKALAAAAERSGNPCLVSLETRMGCGLGICNGCAVDLKPGTKGYGNLDKVLACKAGPVFPARHLAWGEKGP